jgi:hypothetical protein
MGIQKGLGQGIELTHPLYPQTYIEQTKFNIRAFRCM